MSSMTATPVILRRQRPLAGDTAWRRPGLRLTGRGRALVLLVLLLAVAVGGLVLVRAPADAAGATGDGAAVAERVTVRPGETLWRIAERAAPAADPRDTVARIQEMNGLPSGDVQAGRVLLVPAGG